MDCRVLQTLPPSLISAASDSSDAKHQLLLQQFTGPALISYNNAPFRKEDWESIQSLQQSGKAKNPHKVGKFGIGFNSVYHITGKTELIHSLLLHLLGILHNDIHDLSV